MLRNVRDIPSYISLPFEKEQCPHCASDMLQHTKRFTKHKPSENQTLSSFFTSKQTQRVKLAAVMQETYYSNSDAKDITEH